MMANGEKYLFWMEKSEWYDYDENEEPYLTEKAPEKAKKSFEEYKKIKEKEKKSGIRLF